VTYLFTVETFQTVLQMTSGVTATLREGTDFRTLMHAIYPPGSITGAPKVRAMEIISELEDEPRGVYTGAIGMIEPGGNCLFNVAIRTLVLDGQGHGEIGIGSGIVQDSGVEAEFEECLLKMVSDRPARRFQADRTEPVGSRRRLLPAGKPSRPADRLRNAFSLHLRRSRRPPRARRRSAGRRLPPRAPDAGGGRGHRHYQHSAGAAVARANAALRHCANAYAIQQHVPLS
jgi:hypothetical protein